MCVKGSVLRTVVLFLLLGVSSSKCKCNYSEILNSYRELIFVELQNLNLTGTFDASTERDRCPSGKAQSILCSIHGLALQFLCQSWEKGSRQRSSQQEGMEKPVVMMKQLISQNCNPTDLERKQKRDRLCAKSERTRGKKKKRMRLIRALIKCWQKLQSVSIPIQ